MFLVELVFLFGKCLLIIPSYDAKFTLLNKFYAIIMLIIITILSVMVTDIKIRVLSKLFIHIKLVVSILITLILLLFNYNLVWELFFWKRYKWCSLRDQLLILLQMVNDRLKVSKICISCILALFLKLITIICISLFWASVNNVNPVAYCIIFFQYFLIMAHNIYIIFILRILFWGYRRVSIGMSQITKFDVKALIIIKHRFFFLKDAIDNFNQLFSWSLFFNISFTVLYTLNNLDYIFATPLRFTNLIFWRITLDLIMMTLIYVYCI